MIRRTSDYLWGRASASNKTQLNPLYSGILPTNNRHRPRRFVTDLSTRNWNERFLWGALSVWHMLEFAEVYQD